MSSSPALERTPIKEKSSLEFLGEVMANFAMLNVIVLTAGMLASTQVRTRGAAASAHLDPRTQEPILAQLRGCEVVSPVDVEVSSLAVDPDTPVGDGGR